jgi:hypothetical protein
MKRGRRAVDRTGWLRAGGELPEKGPGLSKAEQKHYSHFRSSLASLGIGGKVDSATVLLASRVAARLERLQEGLHQAEASGQLTIPSPGGGIVMNPLFGEVNRQEKTLERLLQAMLLVPRSRSSTRLPAEIQAEAGSQEEGGFDILSLIQG